MRILVLHPGALGDLILALPALSVLRAKYPDAEIAGFARFPVWRHVSLDIETKDLELGGIHRLFSACDPAVTGSADLVVTWLGANDRNFIDNVAGSTGAEIIAASPSPPEDGDLHVSQYLLNSLDLTCMGKTCIAPAKLVSSPDDTNAADKTSGELGIKDVTSLLVIHPGSGARAKCWPALRFVEIIGEWRSTGRPALILEGPADRLQVSEIIRDIDVPVLREVPIGMLISILSRCAAYLGNDSGITHLAAGSGAPVVALFGPTDRRVWGPMGSRVKVISSAAECAPCKRSSWSNCQNGDCMNSIGVDCVWRELSEYGVGWPIPH